MPTTPYDRDPVVSAFYRPFTHDADPFSPQPYQPQTPQYGDPQKPKLKPRSDVNLSWTDQQGYQPSSGGQVQPQPQSFNDSDVMRVFAEPVGNTFATQQPRFTSSSASTGGQNDAPNQQPADPTAQNPAAGGGNTSAQNPGVDAGMWQTAQQWGAAPGYEWLLANPWAIGQYYEHAAAQAAKGESDIDVVDFFASLGYASPEAGRRGYDTMKYRADGTLRGSESAGGTLPFPRGGNPSGGGEGGGEQEVPFVLNNPDSEAYWRSRGGAPKPPGTEDANIAASWYRTFDVPDAAKITGDDVTRYRNWALSTGAGSDWTFGKWWTQFDSITRGRGLNEAVGSGPGPVIPAMPHPEVQPQSPNGQPPNGTTPPQFHSTNVPLQSGEPQMSNPDPQAPSGPRFSTPYIDSTPEQQGSGVDQYVNAVKNLNDLFQPGFDREQKQLLRALMHAGGVSGQLDSGGFTSTVGDKVGQLISNQGQRMGDYAFKDKQNQDALTMQKYIADQENRTRLKELETNTGMQRYIADLNNDLERYKVQSNADLQKMLADQDNVLKRYGIDKNDLLDRYKAELALKGVQYSADKGVEAAALQVAASQAASAAASGARAIEAEMEYKLGLMRLGQENTFNQRQYDLGVLGINRDIYQTDIDNQYKMMMLQWYMSPEARMGGSTPFQLPNMFPYG